jgi:uncharacterized protein YabE (DUF348 family)
MRLMEIFWNQRYKLLLTSLALVVVSFGWAGQAYANNGDLAHDGRLVTIHDRDNERVVLTHANSVRDALKAASIAVAPHDIVEPRLDTELVATNYMVNIYRARPVIVVDGAIRQKIMTAAQTPSTIVADARMTELHDEDTTTLTPSTDIVVDGASTILTIDRAVPVTLQLYGKPAQLYSHAATVGQMLQQKGVKLSSADTVSVNLQTPLTPGMLIAVWRNGVQTATIEEPIAFTVRQVLDTEQPVGYHKVQTPGVAGRKSVTYEITAENGRETGRQIIQSVLLDQPKEEVELVGTKPGPNALSKAKGAQQYTDSTGVTHRETYYDLNMSTVIGACGNGGYTVRPDGAKVDKDGFILIAANYGNYPRCSVVETSMGLGKVYDTGGFAARYPFAFDLATDWSNNDGR